MMHSSLDRHNKLALPVWLYLSKLITHRSVQKTKKKTKPKFLFLNDHTVLFIAMTYKVTSNATSTALRCLTMCVSLKPFAAQHISSYVSTNTFWTCVSNSVKLGGRTHHTSSGSGTCLCSDSLWWLLSYWGVIAAQRVCLLADSCSCYHGVIRHHGSC